MTTERRAVTVEREFLSWDEPLLPAAARRLAAESGRGGRIDAGALIVALPGARAGRRLLELLAGEAERTGRFLVPPRIVTAGALPERLYEPARPLASDALCRHAWIRVLREAPAAETAAVFPHLPERDDLAGLHELARILLRARREVGWAGLDLDAVAARLGAGAADGRDDRRRWNALAGMERRWRAVLERAGRVDRDDARRRALAAPTGDTAGGAVGGVWLLGVAELPPAVGGLLERLDVPVRALVHAPPELADAFDPLGCIRPAAWHDAEVPLDDGVLAVCDRPSDQADEVVRSLAALAEDRAPEEITIGVLDEDLVPYIRQRLDACGIPARHAPGTPLPTTGPWRLLAALADYLDGRTWPAAAALLRHPDAAAWIDAVDAPRVADEFFERHVPARVALGALQGRRAEALDRLLGALEERADLARLAGSRALSAWMPALLAPLREAYAAAARAPRAEPNRVALEACVTLRDAADELHALPPEADPDCGAHIALRLLLAECTGETVPPAADAEAVELVGWLEAHLDDAPILLLAGANEPHLPESVRGDPLLPDSLRSRLGIEDDARRRARDAYRLRAILASRPAVRVIAGRRGAEGDPLRPSRLLFAADGPTAARRVLRFAGSGVDAATPPGGAAAATPPVEAGTHAAPGDDEFRLPPETEIEAPPLPVPFPVTHFRKFLADPYQWALEVGLGLRDASDEARELDGGSLGSVAHAVLAAFGSGREAASTEPPEIAGRLDVLLDAEARRRFGPGAAGAVAVQVEQLRQRLHAFARWQAEWAAAGWRIVAVEASTPPGGVPLEVDGTPFPLAGRIDRIDRNEKTGEWAVLDYKTGDGAGGPGPDHYKSSSRTRTATWTNLQLPLYRHILPRIEGLADVPGGPPGPGDDVRLGYVLLPREIAQVGAAIADWDDAMLADALEAARAAVRHLRTDRTFAFARSPALRPHDPFARLYGAGVLATGTGDEAGDDPGEDEADA
ncbi:MAG: PD-(D/E)XK nuclease family protein [Gemmatimonadota bacterium]|nr:PD-(D/E)XK nuclease family protein [Gemmatimonadota bacterium]